MSGNDAGRVYSLLDTVARQLYILVSPKGRPDVLVDRHVKQREVTRLDNIKSNLDNAQKVLSNYRLETVEDMKVAIELYKSQISKFDELQEYMSSGDSKRAFDVLMVASEVIGRASELSRGDYSPFIDRIIDNLVEAEKILLRQPEPVA